MITKQLPMEKIIVNSTQTNSALAKSELMEKAFSYAEMSKAANTRKAYSSDWKHFIVWCTANGVSSLPAPKEAIALYLTQFAELLKIATLARRLAAISEAHRVAGFDSPVPDSQVQLVWKGIRRAKGVHQNAKHPILTNDLLVVFADFKANPIYIRDRALLLLGFSGAFRRSELISLNRRDLSFVKEGIVIRLKHSKTDQEGVGEEKAIPFGSNPELCPVRALMAWMEASKEVLEPLFVSIKKGSKITSKRLSAKAVSLIVKSRLEKAGIHAEEFSGHSLRSGFATQAALNGASDRAIMQQTKHKTRSMIDRYVRISSIWTENGATKLGL